MNKIVTYASLGVLCLAVLYLMYLNSNMKKDIDILKKSLDSFKKELLNLGQGLNQLLNFTQHEPVYNEAETKNVNIDNNELESVKNDSNKDESNSKESSNSKLTEQYNTYRKSFEYNDDLSNELKQEIDNLPEYNSDNEEDSTIGENNSKNSESDEKEISETKNVLEIKSNDVSLENSDTHELTHEDDLNETNPSEELEHLENNNPSTVENDSKKNNMLEKEENNIESLDDNELETNELLNEFESFQNKTIESDSKKLTLDELKLLNVKDLKQVARDNNLKLKGSKSELIERISKHL